MLLCAVMHVVFTCASFETNSTPETRGLQTGRAKSSFHFTQSKLNSSQHTEIIKQPFNPDRSHLHSMLMYFPKLLCCCRRNLITYTLRKHRGLPLTKSPTLNPVHILLLSEGSIRPDFNNSRRCQIYNCTCGEGAEYLCFLPDWCDTRHPSFTNCTLPHVH